MEEPDKKQKEKDVSDEGLVAADEIDPQRVMAPGGKIDTSFGLEAFHGTATRKETATGMSLLSFPKVFDRVGIFCAIFLCIVLSYWAFISMRILVKCRKHMKQRGMLHRTRSSYSQICYQTMGTVGMWTYDILVVVNLLGVNVAYTIMCGTMLQNMHLGWFSSSFGSIFLSTIILIIPSLLRNAKALSRTSFLGVIVLAILFVTLFIYGAATTTFSFPKHLWTDDVEGYAVMFGIYLFSFGCGAIFLDYQESLKKPEEHVETYRWALVVTDVVYIFYGFILICVFQKSKLGIEGNILDNLKSSSALHIICSLMVMFLIICSYPICFLFSLHIIMPSTNDVRSEEKKSLFVFKPWTEVLVRIMIVIIVSVIAVIIPDFNTVLDMHLIGCIPCLWTMYVFPPLCHFLFVKDMATVPKHIKIRDVLLASFSFIISIAVFALNIYEYVKKP